MSLTDPATLGEGDTAKLEMKLIADKDAKTLTLIDRGCGAPRARRARCAARVLHRLSPPDCRTKTAGRPRHSRTPRPPDAHPHLTPAPVCAGMSKEDLINQLGTVAQSGTSSFIEVRTAPPTSPPTLAALPPPTSPPPRLHTLCCT